jgi:hypothetical protein
MEPARRGPYEPSPPVGEVGIPGRARRPGTPSRGGHVNVDDEHPSFPEGGFSRVQLAFSGPPA